MTKKKANLGDIWLVLIPKIIYDDDDESISVKLEKRPCLIVDDGRGFLIEENSNYSALKLTTKNSNVKNVERKEIVNWKELGLKRKSYIRIELPIKIEPEQLVFKISTLPNEEFVVYLRDLANYFNTDVIEKLAV